MKSQFKLMTTVVTLSLIAGVGCNKTVDVGTCNADAPTFYNAGTKSATDDNATDFDRGKTDGGALGYEDGKAAGLTAAFNAGYNSIEGYSRGYNESYPVAYTQGSRDPNAPKKGAADGAHNGSVDGQTKGSQAGSNDGYYDGEQKGYSVGYSDGYNDGYYSGEQAAYEDPSVCPADSLRMSGQGDRIEGTKVKKSHTAEFNDDCNKLGYEKVRDAQLSYNSGYAQAKSTNDAYKQGYKDYEKDPVKTQAGKNQGYNDGKAKGNADGLSKGYLDVYNSAYGSAYTSSYNGAYNLAYTNAYYISFNTGYADGYRSSLYGYDPGYNVGRPDGIWDYCHKYYSGSSNHRLAGSGTEKYQTSNAYLAHVVAYQDDKNYDGPIHGVDKILGYDNRMNYSNSSSIDSLHKSLGFRAWNSHQAGDSNKWYLKIVAPRDYQTLRP